MLPKRVIFATKVSNATGAGHVRRLIEIAKVMPKSVELHLIGGIDLPWLKRIVEGVFLSSLPDKMYDEHDLVILDSYDKEFCLEIESTFTNSQIIQLADRSTFLLPYVKIIFMDLPFNYVNKDVANRVIAHGIEFQPIRVFKRVNSDFTPRARKVLITSGGVVSEGMYQQLFQEFSKAEYSRIEFNFIGLLNTSLLPASNLKFYPLGDSFEDIAAGCDTAISAAGTTMWDLLLNHKILGLSKIVDNQQANFDYAVISGRALPVFHGMTKEVDLVSLRTLLFDDNIRHNLFRKGVERYDFLGASRTCEVILESFAKSKYD